MSVSRLYAICLTMMTLMLHVAPVQSSTLELVTEVNRVSQLDQKHRENRFQLAVSLSRYWTSFTNRIPRLSPAETEWVRGEIESGDNNRFLSILERREGSLYLMNQTVSHCAAAHVRLTLSIGTSPVNEAKSWLNTHSCYTDSYIHHLFRARLITRPSADAEFNMVWFGIWSQSVVRQALDLLP